MKTAQVLLAAFALVSGVLAGPFGYCGVVPGAGCDTTNQRACEFNGGHSMYCANGRWQYGQNCPDNNSHCECGTGNCIANGK